mgnify:FL=1
MDLYRIRSTNWPVQVSHACGGCPFDRSAEVMPIGYSDPITTPVSRVIPSSLSAWTNKFPWLDPTFAFVFYDDTERIETTRTNILTCATWLVQACEFREIAMDYNSLISAQTDWCSLYKRTRDKILLHRTLSESEMEPYSPLARLTILDRDPPRNLVLDIQLLLRPFHILFLPLGTIDPENPLRRLSEVTPNSIGLEAFIQEITL